MYRDLRIIWARNFIPFILVLENDLKVLRRWFIKIKKSRVFQNIRRPIIWMHLCIRISLFLHFYHLQRYLMLCSDNDASLRKFWSTQSSHLFRDGLDSVESWMRTWSSFLLPTSTRLSRLDTGSCYVNFVSKQSAIYQLFLNFTNFHSHISLVLNGWPAGSVLNTTSFPNSECCASAFEHV